MKTAESNQKSTSDSSDFGSVLAGVMRDYPFLESLATVDYRYNRTVSLLGKHCPMGANLIDVGSWPGKLTCVLHRSGWKVTAIDKEPDRNAQWRRDDLQEGRFREGESETEEGHDRSFGSICRTEGIAVEHVDVECEPLPFATDSLDAVLLTEVIEHLWNNPIYTLTEINRVLKPGSGVLLLSTPNLTSLRHRLNFLIGRVDRVIEHPFVAFLKQARVGHLGHLRLYDPTELTTMLHLLGFRSEVHYDRHGSYLSTVPTNSKETGETSALEQGALARLSSKFLRSPRSYFQAGLATLHQGIERLCPSLRPQVYVVAHKMTDADFEKNCPEDVQAMIERNVLS